MHLQMIYSAGSLRCRMRIFLKEWGSFNETNALFFLCQGSLDQNHYNKAFLSKLQQITQFNISFVTKFPSNLIETISQVFNVMPQSRKHPNHIKNLRVSLSISTRFEWVRLPSTCCKCCTNSGRRRPAPTTLPRSLRSSHTPEALLQARRNVYYKLAGRTNTD